MVRLQAEKIEVRLDGIRAKWKSRRDGGKGSGNWGHAGRPGKVGGSQENPESSFKNRYIDKKTGAYTSFAKEKKKAATPHMISTEELDSVPVGTRVIDGETVFERVSEWFWEDLYTGKKFGSWSLANDFFKGKNVKVAIAAGIDSKESVKKTVESSGSAIGTEKAVEKEKAKPEDLEYTPVKNKSGVFGDGTGYPQERTSSVKILNSAKGYTTLAPVTAKAWGKMSETEKQYAFDYTADSEFINHPLNGKKGYGNSKSSEAIKALTKTIDRCEFPKDCIVSHGIGNGGFRSMFGIGEDENIKDAVNERIGTIGINNGFFSCAVDGGNPFNKPIVMDVFVPKGAKGIYAEPFSLFGNGAASESWDGEINLGIDEWDISSENEVILQRGGAYKITGYEWKNGEHHIICELVDQDPSLMTQENWEKNF